MNKIKQNKQDNMHVHNNRKYMYDQNAMQANKLSLQVKRKRAPANGAIILGPRPLKETM